MNNAFNSDEIVNLYAPLNVYGEFVKLNSILIQPIYIHLKFHMLHL